MNIWENNDLELAIQSVQAARLKLDTELTEARSLEKINGREWKIRADQELELAILKVLQQGSDYPILSEESGFIAGEGNRQWIVDPLDGSANFSRDLSFFCISVGLWEDDVPLLGAVLETSSNRFFTGIVGVGAWCNEDPIQPGNSAVTSASRAMFCTGLPAGFDHSPENIRTLIDACRNFSKIRMLGSAALMLCYVASGRCDSYWESRISLWDVGAALAIVKAAGGVTRLGRIDADHRLDVEAASRKSLLVSEVNGG